MPFNPYPPYPPYPQPNYFQPQQSQPQQPQTNTYAFVNGVEGAKSYPVSPNQSVMLMDSDQPIAYMKTANGMGQATIKYFKLVETDEASARGKAPNAEYVLKSDFDAFVKRFDAMMEKKDA